MEKEQTQDSAQKERNEENTEIREMGTLDLSLIHISEPTRHRS